MSVPNQCCGCTCVIFTDTFTDGTLSSDWTTFSGSAMTESGGHGIIAGGSSIGPTTPQPSKSGALRVRIYRIRGEEFSVKFAYVDANNHWRMDTESSTRLDGAGPGTIDTIKYKFYQVIGGSDEYIGSRHSKPAGSTNDDWLFCWHEGGRIRAINGTFGAGAVQVEWPNDVTGGNSFRIEPDSDLEIDVVTWAYHEIEHSGVSGCLCSAYNCLTCSGEWGDTMTFEVVDGTYAGETVVMDRHRDVPDTEIYGTTSGSFTQFPLSYWYFFYRCDYDFSGSVGGDGTDWLADLNFCFDELSSLDGVKADDTALLSLADLDGTGIGGIGSAFGSKEFTVDDCEGPWEFDPSGWTSATLRITPSAP